MESEDIILRQTTNYQLPSWDSDDRILRTDFNDLTEKTDAAIAAEAEARAANDLLVRLLDYTAPADTSRIDLSVSHINFTQYSRIDLLFRAPNSGTEVYLRVNGAAAGYYYPLDGDSQPLSSDNQRSYLADIPALSGCVATGRIQLLWPASGAKIGCYFNVFASNGTNVSSRSGTLFTSSITWNQLSTLNFVPAKSSTMIPAGTRIQLTGVRL